MHRLTKIINRRMTVAEVFELTNGKYQETRQDDVIASIRKRGATADTSGKYRVKDVMCGIAANMPSILSQGESKVACLTVASGSRNPVVSGMMTTLPGKANGIQ